MKKKGVGKWAESWTSPSVAQPIPVSEMPCAHHTHEQFLKECNFLFKVETLKALKRA